MSTETNQNEVIDSQDNEVEVESSSEIVSVSKKDYDTMNQTIGSMKRQLKDLQKAKESASETTPKQTKADDSVLLQKLERMSLRQAGVTHQDDVELAQKTAKRWGMDIDEVLADEDFKAKLERLQTGRSNAEATSGIKGGVGTQSAKSTPEYWVAKGVPPTKAEVPDRKLRAKIASALLKNARTNNKTFYND